MSSFSAKIAKKIQNNLCDSENVVKDVKVLATCLPPDMWQARIEIKLANATHSGPIWGVMWKNFSEL